MSTGTTGTRTGKSDLQLVRELMKEMGSKNGFDPMPPDQHSWTMRRDRPPLYRLWGWMCAHTIHWGHRTPYATSSQGDTLAIENAAEDLGMDAGNTYRAWREGLQAGLWRNGSKAEGKRRLYLCGQVLETVSTDSSEDPSADPKTVSTDSLPPYILKEIKGWAPERRAEFLRSRAEYVRVRNTALAELMAAGRLVLSQEEDVQLQAWGLAINRQEHTPKLPPEELQARQARLPGLLPVLERFVQTVSASVQACSDGSSASPYTGSTDTPSLLTTQSNVEPEFPSSSSLVTASCGAPVEQGLEGQKPVNGLYVHAQPDATTKHAAASSKPTPKPPTPKPKTEAAKAEECRKLAKALEVDLDAAGQMISGARGADPHITLREILGLCYVKLHNWRTQIREGKVANVAGRLIASLPKAALGGLRDSVRERSRLDIAKELEYARLVLSDAESGQASAADRDRELGHVAELEDELAAISGG